MCTHGRRFATAATIGLRASRASAARANTRKAGLRRPFCAIRPLGHGPFGSSRSTYQMNMDTFGSALTIASASPRYCACSAYVTPAGDCGRVR
jgi:hypothetical protein